MWLSLPNKANHIILLCYSLSMLGSALAAALFFFYVRDVVEAENYLLHFLVLYLVPGLAVLPLWKGAAKRFGAGYAWMAAMLFTVIVFAGVCVLEKGDIIPYGIICVLSGLTFGAEFMLPVLMLKKDNTHVVSRYATLAFLGKVMALFGCAPLLFFTGLFEIPATQLHVVLVAFYGFVPCVVKTAAAFLLWRWMKLNGENDETTVIRGGSHAA